MTTCSSPAASTSTSPGGTPKATAYFREGARLAGQTGDNFRLGRVLLNLADNLVRTDPAAAADAARTAAGHLRGSGDRDFLAFAIVNLVQALLMLGDWDTAGGELTQAADSDRLADHEALSCHQGWLAALRGDPGTAETILAALPNLQASEDPNDKTLISAAEAFTAAVRCQPHDALRHARAALDQADAVGISSDFLRWAWPLAARSAHELNDTGATGELLALLDAYRPGRLAPMQRAERDLVRARLAARDGDQAAAVASFAASITGLRELSTPYHLAHGLLDHAQHLTRLHGAEAARPPSAKPATSPVTCAASHCWTGPPTSRPHNPRYRPRSWHYPVWKNQPRPRLFRPQHPIAAYQARPERPLPRGPRLLRQIPENHT